MPPPNTPSRNDSETADCPICHKQFTVVGRRRYCGDACRQRAWRRRNTTAPPTPQLPAGSSRRDRTIYQCAECDSRYLGEQWCPDCTRPCRRLGPGGHCNCGDLLTVDELLNGS